MTEIETRQLTKEIARRRSFAIISHPDAGKTTLTEKLLLYGGAIQLAGSVKARSNQKKATSDWMELEKQRGISVTSTVLQFEYKDYVLNLLDTPGHNDFSADTYRTLTAADSAVMLVDNAKGVETQTKKLFAVCRDRQIPIFTFVNKMDHEGLGPLALLSEIEAALSIRSTPVNWPIGSGHDFRGIYDRSTEMVHTFSRTARGATKAGLEIVPIDSPKLEGIIGADLLKQLREDIELINEAADPYDEELVLKGELTPVFFGSALTNFGVEPFLNRFIEIAPAPAPKRTKVSVIEPEDSFSAFVFKIQANMNPEHRDRIAFARVASGVFKKDMEVTHVQSGKKLKITRPQRLFAQDRETVEEAYPGDVIGIPNPGYFRLGDTLAVEATREYNEVPTFAPEAFCTVVSHDSTKFKQYEKGIQQLAEEGLIELFEDPNSGQRLYIIGVVGQLQFEVVKFRLEAEYGIKCSMELLSYSNIAWLGAGAEKLSSEFLGSGIKFVKDRHNQFAILARGDFDLQYFKKKFPEIDCYATPGGALI